MRWSPYNEVIPLIRERPVGASPRNARAPRPRDPPRNPAKSAALVDGVAHPAAFAPKSLNVRPRTKTLRREVELPREFRVVLGERPHEMVRGDGSTSHRSGFPISASSRWHEVGAPCRRVSISNRDARCRTWRQGAARCSEPRLAPLDGRSPVPPRLVSSAAKPGPPRPQTILKVPGRSERGGSLLMFFFLAGPFCCFRRPS